MNLRIMIALASSILLLSACTMNGVQAEVFNLELDTKMKTTPLAPSSVPGQKQEATAKPIAQPSEKVVKGMKICLSSNSFSQATDADNSQIYNFEKKTISHLNNKDKTFYQSSLYVIAGFKEPEMNNRVMLRKLLEKTGVKKNPFDPYSASCELGLPFPGQPENPGIEVSSEGNKIIYKHDGKVVVEAQLGADVPLAYQTMLEKYYTYNAGLHPFIRNDLLGRKKFLNHLHYDLHTMGADVTVDQTLVSNAATPGSIDIPPGFRRSFDSKSPLYPFQQKILASGTAPVLPPMDACFKQAKDFVANKQNVDAVFTMLEYNLMTGDVNNENNREIFSVATNDPEVREILKTLDQPTSEEDAKKKLSELERINEKKYAKGYLIEIFKGNLAASLRAGSPPKNFLTALRANPLIVGVYKDLGTFYYSRFGSSEAWDCFELARALKPTHPMLNEVTEIERGIEKRAPAFFL